MKVFERLVLVHLKTITDPLLDPLQFAYRANSCTSSHQSVKLLKFADDTTLIGLISNGDESAYRWEIEQLLSCCGQNNLELNALKTVEMVVDFRKNPAFPPPSPWITPRWPPWIPSASWALSSLGTSSGS
ncbi:hypothetical protein SKAU_G00326840 [Synaphobranchus kaupii]|uniref:Reverse transcriptase domain-containing protein n=1 Tax=Synaphobranchus kaupii TaxID=118154 RepID=A0A9Q1EQ01_SYNKA|nr:hypothetical protein SKAU_G00326840 [Synaphobranchus kaupii]